MTEMYLVMPGEDSVKALPRKPWTIIAAAMIMDVMSIVVVGLLIWKGVGEIWKGDGDVGHLGGKALAILWILCIDRELWNGRIWIRELITLVSVASFALLVVPSFWPWLFIAPLVCMATFLWLPRSSSWFKEIAESEGSMPVLSWRKTWRTVYRAVLAIPPVTLSLFALIFALDSPGSRKYARLLDYPIKEALIAAEPQEVKKVVDFRQDGTNYTAVVLSCMRFLGSGPAVFIYDSTGKRVDACYDSGENGSFCSRWHF